MPTTITCNQCQNQIEITEAIRAELETKVLAETQTKHQQEITLLKQKQADAIKAKEQELEQTKQQLKLSIFTPKSTSLEYLKLKTIT